MAEIINLKRAKKDRARNQKRKDAAVNRAAHGRAGAEKTSTEMERGRADRLLDASRRDKPEDPA